MTWAEVPLWSLYRRVEESGRPDLPLLSVYREHGVVPRAGREDNFNKASEDLSRYKVVHPGDLVLNKMKTWQGSLGVSSHWGIVSPAYFVGRRCSDVDDRFMHHLLRSKPLIAEYGGRSKGIRPSQWDLPWDEFAAIKVRLPSTEEQRTIADFLDAETARIDALIAKKRRLTELLDERRVATLTSYVSGTEAAARCASASDWFPSLPSGWRVSTIGAVTRAIMDGPHVSPTYLEPGDGGVPFISVRNISVEGWDLDSAKYISRSDYEAFSRRIKPERGDVLLTKGGSTGIAREVDLDFDFHVWVHVAIIKVLRSVILPAFLVAVLNSRPGYEQSQLGTRGATNQDLALGRISKIQIPLPPLSEQQRIVDSIAASARPVANAKASLEAQINLLVEHRQALITAAVTGELAVPGAT